MKSALIRLCLCAALVAAIASPSLAQEIARRATAWSARTLDLAESLPIQDGGRIKPLSTYAGFTLLRLHGTRSIDGDDGAHLSPTAWLLDVLFFPDQAARYATFRVDDDEVVTALGLHFEDKKKRDRYSYEELRPGFQRLMALAHDYDAIDPKQRTSLQTQVVHLAENVLAFARLSRHEDLAIVPSTVSVSEQEAWSTPAELTARVSRGETLAPETQTILGAFSGLLEAGSDAAAFERGMSTLHDATRALAHARGEDGKLELERTYYRLDPLSWSLYAFVLAFLAASLTWLWPRARLVRRATWIAVIAGALGTCTAITLRCAIRGRPPVSTLYETVLFVTAVGVLLAVGMEWIHRRRVALSAAAALGMIGLFLAAGYETLDKQDTMPSLVAVLDTNFWLATHVTAITIGYAAGLFAAFLASLYVATRILRLKRGEPDFHRSLARMVYGVLCFGVVFATVGTILGGIWANESWGRFWGWDPKENGALLIVLTELAILHARLGGYLRDYGLCIATAFLGSVVAFSWWGVNLLGVGLHSYGFTSGIQQVLWSYYVLQWSLVAAGMIACAIERRGIRRLTRELARETNRAASEVLQSTLASDVIRKRAR